MVIFLLNDLETHVASNWCVSMISGKWRANLSASKVRTLVSYSVLEGKAELIHISLSGEFREHLYGHFSHFPNGEHRPCFFVTETG